MVSMWSWMTMYSKVSYEYDWTYVRMKYLKKDNTVMVFSLTAFYFVLATRNAWISDDGMITFRVVENFLAGYGLGYNPFVRVQAFTHPLWMLLISFVYFVERLFVPALPNALFHITILVSLLLSFLTVWLLLSQISKSPAISVGLAALTLSLSNSFVDYSTSGLENPLTHLLLVIYVIAYLQEAPNLLRLSFISSLLLLNRMDAFVLVAPSLLYLGWVSSQRKTDLGRISLGLLPVILWEIFSVFYFGFLFPNTAYAKLNTGVSALQLMLQGFDYLLNSINWDPILFFTIALAGAALLYERNRKFVFLFIGVLLYLGYVVKIGGDFMSGRFLTAPLLLSTAIVSNQLVIRRSQWIALGIVILLGVFSLRSPLLASNMVLYLPDYPISDRNAIADERLQYFGNERKGQFNSFVENGFRGLELGSDFAGSKWRFSGFNKLYVADALGKPGYSKGPNTYVIDNFALADPLLARLPAASDWEIGHFRRDIPDGYLETLQTGDNQIVDVDLALYYSKLQIVIGGPLMNWDRIVTIWRLNIGQYDYLLEHYKRTISH